MIRRRKIELMTMKNLCMFQSVWLVAMAHRGSSRAPSSMGSPPPYIFFSYVAYSALMLAQEKNSLSEIYPPSGVGLTRSLPPRQNGSVNINQDYNVLRNSHTSPRTGSKSTVTLTRIKWLLKLKECMNIYNKQFFCHTM